MSLIPGLDQALVLLILLVMLVLLFKEVFRAAIVFFLAVVSFVLLGFLTPYELLEGFANPQLAIIALLLVIGRLIKKTGALDVLFSELFSGDLGYRGFLGRLMGVTAASSAFLNNTPIVATLIPAVREWGKKHDLAPSKLLIPLSYASILGGTATLIGTSTNLVVNGLVTERGMEGFSLFDFSLIGVPLILIGMLYLLAVSGWLLPDRKDVVDLFRAKQRTYLLEARVARGSRHVGKTVDEAGLNDKDDLFLADIIRRKRTVSPVVGNERLRQGDRLLFLGNPKTLAELLRTETDLKFPKVKFQEEDDFRVVEAVIPIHSVHINRTVSRVDFHRTYGASVLAVHRNGKEILEDIRRITLHAGDVLLLAYPKDQQLSGGEQDNLYLVSKPRKVSIKSNWKTALTLLGSLAAILTPVFTDVPFLLTLLVLLGALFLSRTATLPDIRKAIDPELIIIIAFAFAIGKTMINTGAADYVAQNLTTFTTGFGIMGVLLGIYLATNILTEFVTNVAAVSIMFPVAYAAASTGGLDLVPFALTVAYAASASFITPIGYQTNLMVYGAGEYSFKDFFRIGAPLSLLYMTVCLSLIGLFYGFIPVF